MTEFHSMLTAAREVLHRVRPLGMPDDVSTRDIAARAVWSHLTEPGDGTAGRLIADLGPADALAAMLSGEPVATGEVSPRELADGRKRWMPRRSSDAVRWSIQTAGSAGARLLVPGDGDWPEQVGDLGPHAPLALWVRGETSVLGRLRPSVAVVGARAASSYGEHVAMDLAADLAASGIPIVSGAAYGIDGAAHRAALAVQGTTVALLAGGVDRPYPSGHSDLLDRIRATGATVSEVPCGSSPTKWRFLQRNRLIAALADVTVVVEAGWRSGSLNTAAHALAIGRTVGAVPGPITSAASAGSHRLLREDGAICITSADDVRELLGAPTAFSEACASDDRPPTDDSARVRDALSVRAWRTGEDIARRAGMAPSDVEAMLGLLLLSGETERTAAGWRRKAAMT